MSQTVAGPTMTRGEKDRALRQRLKADGLCRDCREPAQEGASRCASCLQKLRDYNSLKLSTLKSAGCCVRCRSAEIITHPGRKKHLCRVCFFKTTAYNTMGQWSLWEAVKSAWDRQGGVCPYTGIALTLASDAELDHAYPVSRFPELRSDPGNVQWVHWRANQMKKDMTHDEFVAFLNVIARHQESLRSDPV